VRGNREGSAGVVGPKRSRLLQCQAGPTRRNFCRTVERSGGEPRNNAYTVREAEIVPTALTLALRTSTCRRRLHTRHTGRIVPYCPRHAVSLPRAISYRSTVQWRP